MKKKWLIFPNNFTNSTDVEQAKDNLTDIIASLLEVSKKATICEIVIIILGTLINLWFLVSILSSVVMRARLRNKLLCNMFVLHLVDTLLVLPLYVGKQVSSFSGISFHCSFYSLIANLKLIQDFIANWLLIILIIVFIAQIMDFDPGSIFTPLALRILTWTLLILPWVASTVLVPVIMHEYHSRRIQYGSWISCPFPTYDANEVFKTIDTTVPILIQIILVTTAVILRFRRFRRGFSSGAVGTELLSRGPLIDNSLAYVVAVVTSFACDILLLINTFDFAVFFYPEKGLVLWYSMRMFANLMTFARVVLMPIVWLLLPDIRERIKTWRPWYRPAPGIDLTVNYKKDVPDQIDP